MADNNVEEINSIAEYLQLLEGIHKVATTTYSFGRFTFYRGQSNESWGFSPSLYRLNLFGKESLLLRELNHICPSEFHSNRFDTLVKMQHFGLPTRLLDATTNPLVALYFACAEQKEFGSDAGVYIFPNLPVMWSMDPRIELIMDFVFGDTEDEIDSNKMQKLLKKYGSNTIDDAVPRSIKQIINMLKCPIIPVMPAKTNSRIEAQDGTFLLLGMNVHKEDINKTSDIVKYTFSPIQELNYLMVDSVQKVVIPSRAKQDILKNLDILGINERKLFPDLTHQIKYAVDFVKNSSCD